MIESIKHMDVPGFTALVFFGGLVFFVCFEAVQVIRGRVHLQGIARAALELLIISPAIILLIVARDKISDSLGLNDLERLALFKWVILPILALIWVPWSHYTATQISARIRDAQSQDGAKK